MILGCDAAGYDEDGNEVVVHAVVSDPDWAGDETLDPKRSLLSERHQGTFAERVVVPRRNVVPKPASLSFEEAACLPTAWLTAYRMLFTQGGLKAGDTRAGAGRRRGSGDGADHPGPGRWPAGVRDQPRRVQACAGARDRRARGLRVRRAAAGEGRRRDGDRGPRHLVALDPVAASRRLDRGQRYDVGPEGRRRRADPDLLPPAARDRLHHGHPRRARLARHPARRHRHPAADRPHPDHVEGAARGSRRWPRATSSARSSSRGTPDGHPPAHRRGLRHRGGRRPAAARPRRSAAPAGALGRAGGRARPGLPRCGHSGRGPVRPGRARAAAGRGRPARRARLGAARRRARSSWHRWRTCRSASCASSSTSTWSRRPCSPGPACPRCAGRRARCSS